MMRNEERFEHDSVLFFNTQQGRAQRVVLFTEMSSSQQEDNKKPEDGTAYLLH